MAHQEPLPSPVGAADSRIVRRKSADYEYTGAASVAPRKVSDRLRRKQIKPAMRKHADSLFGQRGGIMLIMMLTLIIGLLMGSFLINTYALQQYKTRMAGHERALNHLKAGMSVEAERQRQLQKVMGMIEQYNPGMPSEKRYEIASEIHQMSIKYPNLNVDLICATITHESALTWRPNVKSHAGAMGLMQIMPTTGILLAADEDIPWTSPEAILYNPILNIRLGCRYLSTLISLYDLDGGLAAYNGGEKSAALWLASGKDDRMLAEETRGYVPAVLKLYQTLGKN